MSSPPFSGKAEVIGSASPPPNNDAEYENLCNICFTDLDPVNNPRGKINSCDHLFCAHCIKEWAKDTNMCPTCKRRFTRIHVIPGPGAEEEEIKVRKKNYVAWMNSSDSDDDTTEVQMRSVQCNICHSSENAIHMIFCDRRDCVFMAHFECLNFTERPLKYICENCVAPFPAKEEPFAVPVRPPPAPQPPRKIPMKQTHFLRRILAQPPTESAAAEPTPQPSAPSPDDLLYFLKPSKHTQNAQKELFEWKQLHPGDASPFGSSSARQPPPLTSLSLEERDPQGVEPAPYYYVPKHTPPAFSKGLQRCRKRTRAGSPSATVSAARVGTEEPWSHEAALTDPRQRRETAEQLARAMALDRLPVLRRNRFIAHHQLRFDANGNVSVPELDLAAEEALVWQEAVEQCRPLAEQRVLERLRQLREVRERALKVQRDREAVALARLARLVASHRGMVKEQQNGVEGHTAKT